MTNYEFERALNDLAERCIAEAGHIGASRAVRVVRRSGNRWPRALVVHEEENGTLRCERFTVKADRIAELSSKGLLRTSEFPSAGVFVNFGDVAVPAVTPPVVAEIRAALLSAVPIMLSTPASHDQPIVVDGDTQAVSILGPCLDSFTLEWMDDDSRFAALSAATRPITEYLDALPVSQ